LDVITFFDGAVFAAMFIFQVIDGIMEDIIDKLTVCLGSCNSSDKEHVEGENKSS
jgi:hypothetical protein